MPVENTEDTGLCEVCKAPSERRCSACKLVFYCSEKHQQQHWKDHKSTCRPFEESYSKELGRYLKAVRDLNPGDIINSETPLVFGPKPHRIEVGAFPCVGCCRLLNDQTCERCPGCMWPICKLNCEGLKLPNRHGFECNILRLRPPSEEARSFYEFYRAVQEKIEILDENYLMPLKEYEQETDVNAIELTEDIDAMILYATNSILQHSCVPYILQLIDEREITIRAAVPIKKDEHISSIYTHILWGTAARMDHLLQTKYFKCSCNRCEDFTDPCGGVQLPLNPTYEEGVWMCNKCKIKLPEKDIMKFVEHLEVDKLMAKIPKLQELEDLLSKLLHFLHPHHYLVFNVKHSLVQLIGTEDKIEYSVNDWMKKLNLCEELINIIKTIDPGNARLSLYLGVLLNEQFIAQFKILSSTWNNPTQNLYSEQLKSNILNTIEDNKKVLMYEQKTMAGEKLFDVIKRNKEAFSAWLETHN